MLPSTYTVRAGWARVGTGTSLVADREERKQPPSSPSRHETEVQRHPNVGTDLGLQISWGQREAAACLERSLPHSGRARQGLRRPSVFPEPAWPPGTTTTARGVKEGSGRQ